MRNQVSKLSAVLAKVTQIRPLVPAMTVAACLIAGAASPAAAYPVQICDANGNCSNFDLDGLACKDWAISPTSTCVDIVAISNPGPGGHPIANEAAVWAELALSFTDCEDGYCFIPRNVLEAVKTLARRPIAKECKAPAQPVRTR